MMRSVLMMMAIMIEVFAFENHKIEPDFVKDGKYMGIKILDSKVLSLDRVDGLKFCEISDIAYDKSNDRLYAVSDRGRMFVLNLAIKDKKIASLRPIFAKNLTDFKGKKLSKYYQDSEGLALIKTEKKTSLLISFEKAVRVIEYDTNIKAIQQVSLPTAISHIWNFQGENDGLEALTYDKKLGIITTGEYPLRNQRKGYHDIYTQKGKLCAIAKDDQKNAIVEMEMMPDGALLVLLRKFSWKWFSFETTLMKVKVENPKNGVCESEIIAWMSTKKGWKIDNFEGLTHIKDNLYIMISDDNNNPFEKTILTLFEINGPS